MAAIASQRRLVSSTIDLEDSLFQIEGHGVEKEFQFNLGHPEISRSKEAIAPLEGAEDTFHLCAHAADQVIGCFFGEREFPIAGGLVHDAVREPPDLEYIPVQLAAVPLRQPSHQLHPEH